MRITETLQQVVPSAKAIGVVLSLSVGSFLAGVGAVLNLGEWENLPDAVAQLQGQRVSADRSIADLAEGLEEAALERARILCLVRLTATGEALSPLEVTERCP